MPRGPSYSAREDVIILFFRSRRLNETVIGEILRVKLGSSRSWSSIWHRVQVINRQVRDDGYGWPYDQSSNEWDLDAVDAWLAALMRRRSRSELLNLVSIDADTADAIERVSISMLLEDPSVRIDY